MGGMELRIFSAAEGIDAERAAEDGQDPDAARRTVFILSGFQLGILQRYLLRLPGLL